MIDQKPVEEKPSDETAFTTFGWETPALKLVFENLHDKQARKRFFKLLQSCQMQFRYAQTELALQLLRDYFLSHIPDDAPLASCQKNIITALYRRELDELRIDIND